MGTKVRPMLKVSPLSRPFKIRNLQRLSGSQVHTLLWLAQRIQHTCRSTFQKNKSLSNSISIRMSHLLARVPIPSYTILYHPIPSYTILCPCSKKFGLKLRTRMAALRTTHTQYSPAARGGGQHPCSPASFVHVPPAQHTMATDDQSFETASWDLCGLLAFWQPSMFNGINCTGHLARSDAMGLHIPQRQDDVLNPQKKYRVSMSSQVPRLQPDNRKSIPWKVDCGWFFTYDQWCKLPTSLH